MKYFVFHCNNGRNYKRIACGANQSEAFGKIRDRETTSRNLVCVSEHATKREAELAQPRIR